MKIDNAAGQSGAGVGINISAMEGVAFTGAGKAVHIFVDFPDFLDSVKTDHMGQGAVIWGNNVVAAGSSHHDTLPTGANAGINHGYKDRVPGPVTDGLNQAITGFPDVIRRNIMGQIVDVQLRMNGICHTVHSADRAVYQTEIRLKYQMIHAANLLIIYSIIISSAPGLSMENIAFPTSFHN